MLEYFEVGNNKNSNVKQMYIDDINPSKWFIDYTSNMRNTLPFLEGVRNTHIYINGVPYSSCLKIMEKALTSPHVKCFINIPTTQNPEEQIRKSDVLFGLIARDYPEYLL